VHTPPVDAHERPRDYLSEAALRVLRQGPHDSRYRWCNAAMLWLTFYHGLRVSQLCPLKRHDVDLTPGRLWMPRLIGSLATEQPRCPDARRPRKRSLAQRGDSQLPWRFLTARGAQCTRCTSNSLVRLTGARAGRAFHGPPPLLRPGGGSALRQDDVGHRDPKHTTCDPRTAATRFAGLGE
jgi:integrase